MPTKERDSGQKMPCDVAFKYLNIVDDREGKKNGREFCWLEVPEKRQVALNLSLHIDIATIQR